MITAAPVESALSTGMRVAGWASRHSYYLFPFTLSVQKKKKKEEVEEKVTEPYPASRKPRLAPLPAFAAFIRIAACTDSAKGVARVIASD